MSERIFRFDTKVMATGLNPEEVSKQSQAVQIFNPESKKYVWVDKSNFARQPEHESNFISLDEGDEGGDKKFLLEKIGENEYHIKSVHDKTEKETGLLYVSEHTTSGLLQSSSNVLRSKTIAFKEELYVFEFIRHSEQNGVYKIRCKANGKVLFASNDRNSQVRADKEDREISNRIWFQISLEPHTDIKMPVAKDIFSGCSKCIFSGSEESPVLIDEVFNELKYEFEQLLPEGYDQLSSYIEKLKSSEKTKLKANKELNILSSHMSSYSIATGVTISSNSIPMTVKPGEKSFSRSSTGTIFKEKKLEIEMNGKKFNGYKIMSYTFHKC